jgi:ABC-type Na+ efflux pump permease subunit
VRAGAEFLLRTAAKDLRRRLRDPLSLALWIAIPLVVGLLLSLAFGGDESTPRARLLVADLDHSLLSRLLVGAFGQGRLAELVQVEPVEERDGRARMDAGDASALLVIPAGFGSAVLNERPVRLLLLTNPAQRILPRIVTEGLDVMVEAVFYGQRVLRAPVRTALRERAVDGPADSTVADVAVAVNEAVRRLRPYLLPPAVQLVMERTEEGRDERGFAELFFPSMLFLALLFMARGLSGDVWTERSQGTLRRLTATPRRAVTALGGKLVAAGVLMAAVAAAGLVAGRWVFGVRMQDLPLAWLWVVFAGTAMTALFVLVQLHAGSERGGDVLTSAVLFPLAMAGGSFFPFEVMPGWLAAAGRLTPNGWALSELSAILRGEAEPRAVALAFCVVLAAGAIIFGLAAHRLRRFARA